MINVELSSIWSCVSLPDLLSAEKDLYDAHMLLNNGTQAGPDFLGWIDASENSMAKQIQAIRAASDRIRTDCEALVIVGGGSVSAAAEASTQLLSSELGLGPQLIFTGCDLSTDAWLRLSGSLQGKDFCVLLMEQDRLAMEVGVSFRALRWLAERRYGEATRQRIYVAAPEGSSGAKMALDAGYTYLRQPDDPGVYDSALSPAALLPLCVAGVDPLDVLEGARQAKQEYDLRAFENPVWMYAGARHALESKARHTELLCLLEPRMDAFGHWWAQRTARCSCREGYGLMPVAVQLPKQLELLDGLLLKGGKNTFETFLKVPMCSRKVNVELDWKDYDGLAYLDGRSLAELNEACFQSVVQTHTEADVPLIILETEQMTPAQYGELVYFMELSIAISAAADGLSPFDKKAVSASRTRMEQMLGSCS